jgi:hypothetical protein
VWTALPDRHSLRVVASYGYPEGFFEEIGPIAVDAPVMTSTAWLEGRVVRRPHIGQHRAALAAPIFSEGREVGVLTAEFDPTESANVEDELVCRVEVAASEISWLVVIAEDEASRTDNATTQPASSAARPARFAAVRPLPPAVADVADPERAQTGGLVGAPLDAGGGVMPLAAFAAAARDLLCSGSAAVALIQIPPTAFDQVAALIGDDPRHRGIVGRYGASIVAVLLPAVSAEGASERVGRMLDAVHASGSVSASAGIAVCEAPAENALETLFAQAEAALAAAVVRGRSMVLYGVGVIRRDSPDTGEQAG